MITLKDIYNNTLDNVLKARKRMTRRNAKTLCLCKEAIVLMPVVKKAIKHNIIMTDANDFPFIRQIINEFKLTTDLIVNDLNIIKTYMGGLEKKHERI